MHLYPYLRSVALAAAECTFIRKREKADSSIRLSRRCCVKGTCRYSSAGLFFKHFLAQGNASGNHEPPRLLTPVERSPSPGQRGLRVYQTFRFPMTWYNIPTRFTPCLRYGEKLLKQRLAHQLQMSPGEWLILGSSRRRSQP